MRRIFVLLSLLLTCTLPAYADEPNVNNFIISDQPLMTPEHQAEIRQVAIHHADTIFHNKTDPSMGDPKAPWVLVAFVDYNCPISAATQPVLQDLIKANPDLRIIFKELPLHGDMSIYAAKAAYAAKEQGQFLAFHQGLMQLDTHLSHDKILALAKTLRLNTVKLQAELQSPGVAEAIGQANALGEALGLQITPSFFVARADVTQSASPNEILYMVGKFDQKDFQAAIDYVKHLDKAQPTA